MIKSTKYIWGEIIHFYVTGNIALSTERNVRNVRRNVGFQRVGSLA